MVNLLVNSDIDRLKELWPDAYDIRDDECHCRDRMIMYSFKLHSLDNHPTNQSAKPGWEHCGFWCASCEWSNAGSRLIDEGE